MNTLSTALKIGFPDAEGFSPRNIARMKKFYETYKDLSNLPPAVAKLSWTHKSKFGKEAIAWLDITRIFGKR